MIDMEDQNIWYAVILVVGSLIGALLGYLASMRSIDKQFKLSTEREKKEFKRNRIEKCSMLLSEIKIHLEKCYRQVRVNKEKRDTFYEISDPYSIQIKFSELTTYVKYYFKNLDDNQNKLKQNMVFFLLQIDQIKRNGSVATVKELGIVKDFNRFFEKSAKKIEQQLVEESDKMGIYVSWMNK